MIPADLYLADTSAIARVTHPHIHAEMDRLGRLGLLATCVTIDLKLGYFAPDPAGYVRTAQQRAVGFVDLPLHPAIGDRARAVQTMLARRS